MTNIIHQKLPGGIPTYSSPSIWRGRIIASSRISWNFLPDACCFYPNKLLHDRNPTDTSNWFSNFV